MGSRLAQSPSLIGSNKLIKVQVLERVICLDGRLGKERTCQTNQI